MGGRCGGVRPTGKLTKMDIRDKSVLILGGYGLVGSAIARRILKERPSRLILLSLKREEAEEAVRGLHPERGSSRLEAAWGDVFALVNSAAAVLLAGALLRRRREKAGSGARPDTDEGLA